MRDVSKCNRVVEDCMWNVLELFAEEMQIFKVNLGEQWQECDKTWGTMSVECT